MKVAFHKKTKKLLPCFITSTLTADLVEIPDQAGVLSSSAKEMKLLKQGDFFSEPWQIIKPNIWELFVVSLKPKNFESQK